MKKHLLSLLFIAISYVAFSQITITSSVTNVSCFGGSNGSATLTASGGSGAPYTYTLFSSPFPTSSTGVFTGLVAGTYSLSISDASANTTSTFVTITQPTQLNVNANILANSCPNNCSGAASLTTTGGTPPYNYQWSSGYTWPYINFLCPGIYTYTVIDIQGCVASNTAAITLSPPLNISVNHTNPICNSSCNSVATVSVSNGLGPFTYTWIPSYNMNSTASNLCSGNQTVNVRDASGCFQSYTFNIIPTGTISNLSATLTPINETCFQSGDGQINLTLSGSNPGPFTYQWNNGATTQNIYNITSNNYWVEINDGTPNGCISLQTNVGYDGINCGTISGNVFIDNNSDCIKNSGDVNLNNVQIVANPGNRIGFTNWLGDYIFNNLPFGTYTLTSSINTNMIATCSTTLNSSINSGTPNSTNNNFSKEYIPATQPDLYVSAYSNGIVPGFVCRMNYYCYNYNTFNANGIFKATLPSAFIPNITNVFPSNYTLSADTIIWNFANINYMNWSPNFYIDFTTPLSTPLGSTFTSCMWAQPTVADLNYSDNSFCYQRTVTGSYDPNDKTVSPVGVGATGDIAASVTDLTYLIRFQNTGNGPAVNIFIKDTLSTNVDVNTFEMLGSSHNYIIDILPGNILRWKFNNIMLPDSNSNEPGSHGYVQYRIKRTNNNTPGTQIKNTAYIYFDFNEPIVTNTAINTIETITGIKSSSSNSDEWNVYPNPSTGVLYIVNSSSVKEESQIQVINSIGQTVLEETITSNYKNIDLSKLNNGVYFVKITSDKSSTVKRIVLSK